MNLSGEEPTPARDRCDQKVQISLPTSTDPSVLADAKVVERARVWREGRYKNQEGRKVQLQHDGTGFDGSSDDSKCSSSTDSEEFEKRCRKTKV